MPKKDKAQHEVPQTGRIKHEELDLLSVRIEISYMKALREIAASDPDRATISTLVRKVIRAYLLQQGKLDSEIKR